MNLKLLRWFLLMSFIIILSGKDASASHAMGADLTYQCLGGNTYKIRLSFYRDCIGIAAPANVYVNVRSISCGKNLGVTCNPIPGTGQEVNYLCPTATTTCNGGSFTGIQEWVYDGIITLPTQCTDWTFSYSLCCRNAAISTISGPGSNTFYIYATLNNVAASCNSSPVFYNKPVPFSCLGQQFCFNHGAVDVDGDSLVYSLVNPKQTATTNVSYLAPYSATAPLNSSPALQFNSMNGDICFTPQQSQVTVMAVLVKEYRNGVLIGSVVRDIQVTVINCNNNLPTLSGINGTNNYNISVCANTNLCFNVLSNDIDNGQNLNLFWNQGITAATFTQAGSPHPTGTFCWKPSTADISNNPYCFTVRVSDNSCPYTGSQTYSYCITVKGIIVNAGPDQYIACSDQATISATASNGQGPYTYLWSNGYTGQIQTVPVGTYIVTVSDGTCSNSDTVNVISAFEPVANFNANPSCVYNAVSFTDQSTTAGSMQSWFWNFGDGSTSGLQNPAHIYSSAGTYQVTLVIQNIYGCVDTIIKPVTILPQPVPAFTIGTSCAGTSVQFSNTSLPSGSLSNWTFSNGAVSNQQSPSINFGTAGSYTATLIVSDTSGCSDTLMQNFIVHVLPVAAFSNSAVTCISTPVIFTDNSTGSPVSWNWNFGDGQSSSQQNPSHVFSGSGTFSVSLTVTNAYGCTNTIVQQVLIHAPPFVSGGQDASVCNGSSLILNATGGITYSWIPGNLSGSTITVTPSGNTNYIVTGTDANGCTASDTVAVSLLPLPVPVATPPNQSVCLGQSVTLSASGGVSYYWNPSGATSPTITIVPSASTTYAVDVTGANGCIATAFINITVHQNPVVNLQPAVFICSGGSATLNAGNVTGNTYQWSSGQTSSAITTNTSGTYTLTVTNTYGCSTVANTQVTVGGQIVNNNNTVAICQGQSAVLNAGYSGNTYLWSNGSTSQTISVNSAGVYQVTVTDPGGCSGVIANTVVVNQLPVVNFTPVDVCISSPVLFQDVSYVNGDSLTAWSWDFGDGNISYQQNPQHTYNAPGSYAVSLTVSTSSGCSGFLPDTVNVYPLPTANFNYMQSCQGSPVLFQDQSLTTFGNIVSWSWDFGDNTTSAQQNPRHIYTAPGTYTVNLTVSTTGGCTGVRTRTIQIFPKPLLAFTPTAGSVCSGSVISLTNSSSTTNGSINNWSWDFGDGSVSSQQQPAHLYTIPGTFNITLIATTNNGCSDTLRHPVTVIALPNADAGANVSICAGTSTNLTATGGTSYLWSAGGATTPSITVSPAATITTYYVTVTNAQGCSRSDSVRVTLKALPVANAGPDKQVCIGANTTLTASGGGTYLWTPGNNITAGITVNPAATTNYIVTVTGSNGCSGKDTAKVIVNPLPVANAGPDQVICQGTTTSLTASGGSTYYWYYNGSSSSTVYVNPSTPATYIVNVTNASGCSARDTVMVSLNPTPAPVLSNGFFCTGYAAVLDAGIPGMTYDWSPGGASSQSISVNTPGTYTVVVTNSFGCRGTATASVTQGGAALSGTPQYVQVCTGTNVTLDAGNPGMTYQWSTGQNTQTINTLSGGLYTVTVSDGSGCNATFTDSVTVHPNPAAEFTSAGACLGNAIAFNDSSSISQGNIIGWSWNFGNGYSSNLASPTVSYTAAGTYPVTLTTTSGMGCTNSVTHSIVIDPVPVAAFSASTVCQGYSVKFSDASTIAGGSIGSWSWTFGDGSTSYNQSPTHVYANAGTYAVMLIVSSGTGCRDTVFNIVTINPKPQADFQVQTVCSGDSTLFIDASYVSNGFLSDYEWNFGDGSSSFIQTPSHLYASPGVYTATLYIATDKGCIDSLSKQVTVNERPSVNITNTNPSCDQSQVLFTDQTTISNGTLSGWYWNFGDGSSSGQQNPVHLYAAPGNYSVLLIATSQQGCSDSAMVTAVIHALPQSSVTASNVCEGSVTQFTAVTDPAISDYSWNFGDGTFGNGSTVAHNYNTTGTYNSLLVITSSFGCTDSIRQQVNVYPVPLADFISSNVCFSNQTLFTDHSSVLGGGTFTYQWNLGDGTTDTSAQFVHSYLQAGVYNAQIIVTTAYGCSNTITEPVTVYELPQPSFSAGNVCLSGLTEFQDGSSVVNGTITSWNWNLGDSTITSAQNPEHIYGNAGSYTVNLEVTSNYGCRANTNDSVTVLTPPTPRPTALSTCMGDNVPFSDTSSGSNNIINSWGWDFGDGSTSSSANPVYAFSTPGLHTVTLTTVNSSGCRATASLTVNANPLPDANFNTGPACTGSAVSFNNTSTIPAGGNISGYTWNFGDGSSLVNTSDPSHLYPGPGTYSVTLSATSNEGCIDSITQQVIVYPLPVSAFTQTGADGCGPVTVNFTDSSYIAIGAVASWQWDFGDGSGSALENPSHQYTQSGTYSVTLTVTSSNGCSDSYTRPNVITVYPGPYADFSPDPETQSIINPQFSFNNLSSGALTYAWTFGDGSSSSVFEPQHLYGDTGTYHVILWVTNSFGCKDSASHTVRVEPEFGFWIPNAFSPNDDGVNDGFNVVGISIVDVKLSIFNQWGAEIFYSEGRNNKAWDGSVMNEKDPAQEGVYVYMVKVKDVWGGTHEKIGHVNLVR